MATIRALINKIENMEISFLGIISLFFMAMFVRTFLENYANLLNFYHMSSFIDTFFHYPIFFSIIFLFTIIIAKILTKENIYKITKVIALFSFIIILPPIVDLIVNKGGQIPYIFISNNYPLLFKSFITYFGGGAIGLGIKTEVAVALTVFGCYIYNKTKNKKSVLAGIFLLYSAIFIMLAFPTFVFSIQNTFTKEYKSTNFNNIIDFYYKQEPSRIVTGDKTFILDKSNFLPESIQKIQNQYSITLSIIFLITSMLLIFWSLFLHSSKKFFAVIKNFRYLRIVHYLLLASFGVYIGIGFLGKNPIGSLFDFMSFTSLFFAILFAWLFAVWENDEIDIEIDKISNQNRPLINTQIFFSIKEWQILKYIFLFYSLSFAFLCSFYTFTFIILFILIYHIYSVPPLKLKRFLGISSLLIAINALLTVLMGFFISSGTENLNAFPSRYAFGILIIFLLVENIKNIKDIEGDKREGIKTLPVILGEKRGKLVIGVCLFLGALLVPFIFYLDLYTLALAIFFGFILFLLTNRKKFEEKYIFLTYFIYVFLFLILINL